MRLLKAILLLIVLSGCITAFTQENSTARFEATSIPPTKEATLQQTFTSFKTVHLSTSALTKFVKGKNASVLTLILSEELNFTLELEPSAVVSPDYSLQIQTPEGVKVVTSKPDYLFKGKVKGTTSDARLTINDGFLYGYIKSDSTVYYIEPLKSYDPTAQRDEFVIYKGSDVKEGAFTCGVNDAANMTNTWQQREANTSSTQNSVCRKIKFISFADHSIYQKFNESIADIETAFLSNLNMAEGAFQTLNLQNSATDTGADGLQFEMEKIVIATCQPCDPVGTSNYVNDLLTDISNWIKNNPDTGTNPLIQLYTTRDIYVLGQPIVGYANPGAQIIKYHTDAAATLRVIVAHETGHNLGCQHDNQIRGSVTNRIMYSSAGPNHTTFSTLLDFGGVNYSSHKVMKEFVLNPSPGIQFVNPCQQNTCQKVEELKVTYTTNSQVQLSWKGTGSFLIKYKIRDSARGANDYSQIINGNTVTLQNLVPCTVYTLGVQRICPGSDYSNSTTIEFSTSPVSIGVTPVNFRNELFDLQLNVDCKNCPPVDYLVKVDNKPYLIHIDNGSNQFAVKDLFADGARHKVSIQKDTTKGACKALSYFIAPYYRANSKDLLSADFNDCRLPAGWQDSVIRNVVPNTANPHWFIGKRSPEVYPYIASGTIDSTCMAYYNNFSNSYKGSIALTSPSIDLNSYTNSYLHFDYNFVSYNFPNTVQPGSFIVQVYDGNQWQTVMKISGSKRFPIGNTSVRNIWDTMPARQFINLDTYKNTNFKIRFVADDGSMNGPTSTWVFAALDNIRVDGYSITERTENEFTIFPNPASSDLFVRFKNPFTNKLTYRLVDIVGREVAKGDLLNYRIPIYHLSSGIYIVQLYENGELIGTRKIAKQ